MTQELFVDEIFASIQGEGYHAGTPSVFLRMQGCNLRCPWCDEPEALEFRKGKGRTAKAVVLDLFHNHLLDSIRVLILTGGEPSAQDCGSVIDLIRDHEADRREEVKEAPIKICIETNGTLPAKWLDKVDWITLSPKTKAGGKAPHPFVVERANEIKIVVEEDTDIKAEYDLYAPYFTNRLLPWFYLMPEDGQREKVSKRIFDFVMAHPDTSRFCVRQHKVMGVK